MGEVSEKGEKNNGGGRLRKHEDFSEKEYG
jgi:hypothetical protein